MTNYELVIDAILSEDMESRINDLARYEQMAVTEILREIVFLYGNEPTEHELNTYFSKRGV